MALKITHPESVDSLGFLKTLSDMGVHCSGVIRALMESHSAKYLKADVDTSIRATWAGIQWLRSGKPIFRLEKELVEALVNTNPPRGILERLPKIPYQGIYIALDGEFFLEDSRTGMHACEGIYIVEDLMRTKNNDITAGLLVLAVGENKSKSLSPLERDDTIQYFGMVPGMDLDSWNAPLEGLEKTLAVVLNLLFMMGSEKSSLEQKAITPNSPKSPKKLKRAKRKGISFHKYISLSLSESAKSAIRSSSSSSKEDESWDGPTYTAIVRGHWHKYWVLKAEERQVFGEKDRDGKRLYLIRKWVAPYPTVRRGSEKRNLIKVVR